VGAAGVGAGVAVGKGVGVGVGVGLGLGLGLVNDWTTTVMLARRVHRCGRVAARRWLPRLALLGIVTDVRNAPASLVLTCGIPLEEPSHRICRY
jgi:hypothetical protein